MENKIGDLHEEYLKRPALSKAMFVYYCGSQKCESNHDFGPAVRSQYLLHFVVSGKGEYTVNGNKFNISQGQIFLIRPGELTYYRADDRDPWEYMWVAFDGFEARDLIERIGLQKDYILTVPRQARFAEYIRGIIYEFGQGNYGSYKVLGYFYNLMSELEKNFSLPTFEEEYLEKAVEYIHNNYSYPIKISDIARYVGIDRTYLYKLFMNSRKISPKQYLLLTRINAAKTMLVEHRYSVNEIALSCGFSDSAAFCNYFKKITGNTPKQFVNQLMRLT